MRTARSQLLMLTLIGYALREVVVIHPDREIFSEGQREELEQAGLKIRCERRLREVLNNLDVIYINSIAWVGDTYETLTGDMRLPANLPLREGRIILHPPGRREESVFDLDGTSHNCHFAQVRGAVFVHMVLLTCLVLRIGEVIDAGSARGGL